MAKLSAGTVSLIVESVFVAPRVFQVLVLIERTFKCINLYESMWPDDGCYVILADDARSAIALMSSLLRER
jgi:hypothetical protein